MNHPGTSPDVPARLHKQALRALIPHAGSMCLLDEVCDWTDATILCRAGTHRDPAHPLRGSHGLAALHLAEYAAQAMAVHGALLSRGGAQAGLLGALRDMRLHTQRIDHLAGPLVIEAQRRLARADGLLYDFRVSSGAVLLCDGRIAVVLHGPAQHGEQR